MDHNPWCNRTPCLCNPSAAERQHLAEQLATITATEHCTCWRRDCDECGRRAANGYRKHDRGRKDWL